MSQIVTPRNIWTPVKISSWNELQHCLEQHCQGGNWLFRGQSDASWGLKPSLERATEIEISSGGRLQSLVPAERSMLQRFHQRAHQFLRQLPADEDIVDWFALMQHYGAPTRLLDWTASPYVATYFALESSRGKGNSAIWGISSDWLERAADPIVREADTSFPVVPRPWHWRDFINNRLLSIQWPEPSSSPEMGVKVVLRVHPRMLDERMAAQQGAFLCSLEHSSDFQSALASMVGRFPPQKPVFLYISIPNEQRIPILREISRMNVHRASLFPGLDGFARSLGLGVEIDNYELESSISRTRPQASE